MLKGLERQGVGRVLVNRDDPGGARMGGFEHLAEEAYSRLGMRLEKSVGVQAA